MEKDACRWLWHGSTLAELSSGPPTTLVYAKPQLYALAECSEHISPALSSAIETPVCPNMPKFVSFLVGKIPALLILISVLFLLAITIPRNISTGLEFAIVSSTPPRLSLEGV